MVSQNKNLVKFFSPDSIAIIGATDGLGKVGTAVTRNILELDYAGKVFLINPKRTELYGKKCYAKLEDIEEEVDLAVIIVPADFVADVIKNAGDKTKNFVIISAGFSETGKEGRKREEELAGIAKEKNLNVLGPNCLGFIMPRLKLNATFAGGMPKRGNIGFISQSGALAVAIMDIFEKERLGFSGVVSIGNKMQINEADLIECLGNNPDTKVTGLYLEGIKDGRKFMETAQKVSRLKPVVILKAGKTEKSKKAISLHTGALAGSEEITAAVFKKCGIVQAQNLEEFINMLRLFSVALPPAGDTVAVITNAGGGGVLASDAFENKIIKLAGLTPQTQKKLKEILPEASSTENPIDVLGDAREDRYEKVLNIINNENIGSIICLLTPQEQTPVDKITGEIVDFSKKTQKTIAAVFMGGEKVRLSIEKLNDNNIPNFSFPDQAVRAIDAYCRWEIGKKSLPDALSRKENINPERRKKAGDIIQKVKTNSRKALLFSEVKHIMEIYGIDVVDASSYNSGRVVKFPAVVKVDSDKILHKVDKEGVILNVKYREELERAVEKIKNRFPGENIIVQPMVESQTEIIIGIKRDEIFGPVVVYGLGGIYTEVFQMVDFLVPPFDFREAGESLVKSKIKFLFEGIRGKRGHNSHEVAGILEKVGLMARENPEIRELDINPLFVYNDGRKALAVDIKIII